MKFYNRETEIEELLEIERASKKKAQMTLLIGRRRIGKTTLLTHVFSTDKNLYFFIAKKNETLLCEEFVQQIEEKLNVKSFGTISNFKDLFAWLMEISKTKAFTLIIDEFQEFVTVNPSVYSDIQNIWDSNKQMSKLNLILCGSIYSIMKRIFENSKEPLFGRPNHKFILRSFKTNTLKEILSDYSPDFTSKNLFDFYLFTGGVAKYIEIFVEKKAFNYTKLINTILSDNSYFLEEGRAVLVEEFGKDYGNHFSILSLIASGKTSRVEIESILAMQTGGFLDRLENEYNIIRKVRPILAKPDSRSVKYKIEDNFLNFWFRFIYKYKSAVEIRNYNYLKAIVKRDYDIFSGVILEKYFRERLIESMQYNQVGSYWESANKNEIDIVAINDMEKKVLIAEVKLNAKKISITQLKQKAVNIEKRLPKYTFEYKGFSLKDVGSPIL